MEYRTFPGTDLDISVIVFGSWANGGWLPEARENAIGAIRAAWQAGVTTIDTAPLYGLGDAESIVGEAIACLPRDSLRILTKFGLRWDGTAGTLFRTVARQNGRPADIVHNATGKSMRIVSNQIHYSMLSRGLEKQTVKYCMDHDMAVLAYRPLESGLLTGTLKPGTVFPDGDFRRNNAKFSDENIRRTGEFIRLLKPLAEDKKISIAQLVLRWTAQRPGITGVLAGAMNAAQAVENARAGDIRLSDKEMGYIDSILPPP